MKENKLDKVLLMYSNTKTKTNNSFHITQNVKARKYAQNNKDGSTQTKNKYQKKKGYFLEQFYENMK